MIEKVLVGQIDGDRSTCRSIEMGRQVELYIGIHWNGKGIMNEAQRLGQTSFFCKMYLLILSQITKN